MVDLRNWSKQFEWRELVSHMYGRQPFSRDEQSKRTALCGWSMQIGHLVSSHSFSVPIGGEGDFGLVLLVFL